jgi:phosphoglycolate phosphatase-like HAD superfamily hydrolase
MSDILARIRNIAWDFDGVKYSYHAISGLYDMCDRVCAENAMGVIKDINFETALDLGHRSYRDHGDSVGAFIELARERGLDVDAVRMELFKGYHIRLRNRLEQTHPHVMAPDQRLIQAFGAAAGDVQHGIATHSCIESWARPYLRRMEILEFFNEAALVGLDHVDFTTKAVSPRMVQECLTRMNADPRESVFVDDSLKNLERAKDIGHLKTVYAHQGKPLETLPSYVDYQTENNLTLMQELVAAKGLVLAA